MLKKCRVVEGKITEVADGPLWIVTKPDDDDKRLLVTELKIDDHTLSSALDPDELSRVEFEPEHVAIIFKRPKNYSSEDNHLFKVVSNGLFLFPDRLVIVMAEDVPIFEGKQAVRAQTPHDALLRILYRSVFHFLEHLRIITMISDSVETQINQALENRHLLTLFKLQKSLVYYLNGLNTNAVVIEKLKASVAKIGFNQEQQEFLDDIAIENQQCFRQAEIYSSILAGLMDARVSIVNNNLSVLMKTLNVITLSIMVPTFVVSAFSMNVPIPGQHQVWSFAAILGLAALAAAGFVGLLRIKKW